MKIQTTSHKEQGFTIIELMIATLIFSVILLVITFGVISFTNSYYKGVNSSTTQVAAQNAIDSISQAAQFSSADSSPGGANFFCAGTKLYVYTLGEQYTGNPALTYGLYEMDKGGPSCVFKAPANGTELLGEGMRVVDVSISETAPGTGSWKILLRIANGDADLLCRTSKNGTLGGCLKTDSPNAPTSLVTGNDVTCKSQRGSQFCSIAAISTVAQQRIVN